MSHCDSKKLKTSLGGESDENGFLTVEIFSDREMGFYLNCRDDDTCDRFIEGIPISVAKQVRDFLIYALKD